MFLFKCVMSMALFKIYKNSSWGYIVTTGGYQFVTKLPDIPFITIVKTYVGVKQLKQKYKVIPIPFTDEYVKDANDLFICEIINKQYRVGRTNTYIVTNVKTKEELEKILQYFNEIPVGLIAPLFRHYKQYISCTGNSVDIGNLHMVQNFDEMYILNDEEAKWRFVVHAMDLQSHPKKELTRMIKIVCQITGNKKKIPEKPSLYQKVETLGDYFLYTCGLNGIL